MTQPYYLKLNGSHQLLNSGVAVETINQIRKLQGAPEKWAQRLTEDSVRKGIERVKWRARQEWIYWKNRRILLDGAHNDESAHALRRYIDKCVCPSRVHWIVGMLAHKNHAHFLQEILREGDSLSIVKVNPNVSWLKSCDTAQLKTIAGTIQPNLLQCKIINSVEEELEQIGHDEIHASKDCQVYGKFSLIWL